MKKITCILMTLAMVLSLCACGAVPGQPAADASTGAGAETQAAATGEKITVILPRHELDTIGFYEEKTREFEEATGIEVELILMSWDQVADRLTTDLAAGGGTYDVIELDNAWVEKFVKNDWIAPLDDYVTPEIKSGVVPGLLDKFSSGGSLYGITWNNDTRFYMYNAAKLKEVGIDKAPETWDEALEDYKALSDAGLVSSAYIDCYNQEWAGASELIFLCASFGGKLIDDDGKPVMGTDPKTKAAYQFLVDGINNGFIDPSSLTSSQETTNDVFCMGDTFMFLQAWPSVYASANNPDTSNIVGEVEVADYIIHDDGAEGIILTLPEAMSITSTSEHKDAAWKYIEFMSSHDVEREKCLKLGALPIWTDLLTDPELLEMFPYWKNFSNQIDKATGLPSVLWYDEFVEVMTVESQRILLGEVSVEEGLASMQEQCEALASEYDN
ncbi:MAG: extracellular solute-binding protein [Lachnospiraceae bacterium]|nr:extracellular solute-binding protein [Lachnospiraceae bacterium]